MASHERYRLFFLEGSLILILSIGCVTSKTQQTYTCGSGISTPGYTYPKGDIALEYGASLNIMCILHDTKAAEYGDNASSFMSIIWNGEAQPTDIVNSTAIRLHIEKHPKTKQNVYTCMLNRTFVCHNVVIVGTKPQNVTDFNCIGHNYENLTCNWTAPENVAKTDYYLSYIPWARPARYKKQKTTPKPTYDSNCPDITYKDETNTTVSCTWSLSTRPQYRHSHPFLKFYLRANNTFGNRSWEFEFDHYPHVIPNPPENLTGYATSPHSITLSWKIPTNMQSFPGGIEHRVVWCIERRNKEWVTLPPIPDEKIEHKVMMKYELLNLPYAHDLYDIRVSMKSLKATDENMWSQNATVVVRTQPKLPDSPPKTDIGSFEILEGTGNHIIYWQNIPAHERNGENLSYHIEVEGHPNIKPKKLSSNYARFEKSPDQNYLFRIWSKNEIGLSENYSTVFVPSSVNALKPPSKVIKVDKGYGVYDIEWTKSDDNRVISYTLFWCADTNDRPYQCDGAMKWKVLAPDKKNDTLRLPNFSDSNKTKIIYQFAIAANSYQTSSGMAWAECTVIPGRGAKLRQVYVRNVGTRSITVVWKLECVKMGDVIGFNVTYCPVVSDQNDECKNNSQKSKEISGSNSEEGVIDGLTPYTTYKIQVKPLLIGAESQFSEPMCNSTFEDEPTEPRKLRVINKTDSSMFIKWKKPDQENGRITYNIYFNDQKMGENIYAELNKDEYEENITNLTARTQYKIEVRACTNNNINKCSRAVITDQTNVGIPGVVSKPSANWDNTSLVIRWDKPAPRNLKVDYYDVWLVTSTNGQEIQKNENATGETYLVSICEKDKSQNVYVKVRAVNEFNGKLLHGGWSEGAEFLCIRSGSSETWVIIVIVMSIIVFIALMIYLGKQLWVYIRDKQNISAKLPEGLENVINYQETEKHIRDTLPQDEPLLPSKHLRQPRNPSDESSGCCSVTDSVASSVESAGHLSVSDSGTDQPRSPTLGDTETKAALRQRVNKPSSKKSDYVQMPEFSPSPYSKIGLVTPTKKPEVEHEYMPLTDIAAKSSFVPFPVAQTQESVREQHVKPTSSGYVPCMIQEPAAKNTEYVLAGVPTKPNIVLPKVPSFTQREETSSGYVKHPPISMEAPKLLMPWQQQSPVEPPSKGYVVVGDTKPQMGPLDMQKSTKPYVPHNIKFDTTKSLKED